MSTWGPPDVSWGALSGLLVPFSNSRKRNSQNLRNETIFPLAREILQEKTSVCSSQERVLIALCHGFRAVYLTQSDRLFELAQD